MKDQPKQTIEEIAQDFAKSKSSSEIFQHTHIRDFLAGYNHAQTEIEELLQFVIEVKETTTDKIRFDKAQQLITKHK
jgi:hypothetical protein